MKSRVTTFVTGMALAFFLLILVTLGLASEARADEMDQSTKLTFNAPVEVPGQVLAPGTYWFVVSDEPSENNVVRIFSEDRTKVIGIFETVSAERPTVRSRTELVFAENPNGPVALMKWFYPGQLAGHEFHYDRQEERQLNAYVQSDVLAMPYGAIGENPSVTSGE